MSVTVFSTPSCVQCKMTTKALDKKGIAYMVVDLTKDSASMDRLKALGYMQAPIIEAGDDRWSGFQPAKIEALAAAA